MRKIALTLYEVGTASQAILRTLRSWAAQKANSIWPRIGISGVFRVLVSANFARTIEHTHGVHRLRSHIDRTAQTRPDPADDAVFFQSGNFPFARKPD